MVNKKPLMIHQSFKENLILVAPDLRHVEGLKGIGYGVIGEVPLAKMHFVDHGSVHQYNLAGGFQIPLDIAGYSDTPRGNGDLYLITFSWENTGIRVKKSYGFAVNPDKGALIFERGRFRLDGAGVEPVTINRILGYLPHNKPVNTGMKNLGTLLETRNLDCNSKIFWLEDFMFRKMVHQGKRLSLIDFDPDDGICLG